METKVQSKNSSNIQAPVMGLALAAALAFAGEASANGRRIERHGTEVSGRVEVVKEIPGGAVHVGVEVGRPREVVVVEQRPVIVQERKVVVVKQEDRCGRDEKVTIIRKTPDRTVIIKQDGHGHGHGPDKVIVIKDDKHGKHGGKHHGRGHGKGKGHGHDRNDRDDRYGHYDHDGKYRYYEDDRMVSIHEVRDGQSRNVYIRK